MWIARLVRYAQISFVKSMSPAAPITGRKIESRKRCFLFKGTTPLTQYLLTTTCVVCDKRVSWGHCSLKGRNLAGGGENNWVGRSSNDSTERGIVTWYSGVRRRHTQIASQEISYAWGKFTTTHWEVILRLYNKTVLYAALYHRTLGERIIGTYKSKAGFGRRLRLNALLSSGTQRWCQG